MNSPYQKALTVIAVAPAIAVLLCGSIAEAKPKSKETPQPDVTIDAANAKPSATLSRVIEATVPNLKLGSGDLSKISTKLAEAQAVFSARQTVAPVEQRGMYSAAIAVCKALTGAIEEHDRAAADLHQSAKLHASADEKDMDTSNVNRGRGSGVTAKANVHKQLATNRINKNEAREKDAFFSAGAENAWENRRMELTKEIQQAYGREVMAEAQLPASSEASAAKNVQAAEAPAAKPAAEGIGFSPVGVWHWYNKVKLHIDTDQSFKTSNGGSGKWEWIDKDKREVKLEFNNGNVSKLILSADSKTLTGEGDGVVHHLAD